MHIPARWGPHPHNVYTCQVRSPPTLCIYQLEVSFPPTYLPGEIHMRSGGCDGPPRVLVVTCRGEGAWLPNRRGGRGGVMSCQGLSHWPEVRVWSILGAICLDFGLQKTKFGNFTIFLLSYCADNLQIIKNWFILILQVEKHFQWTQTQGLPAFITLCVIS